MRTSLYIFIGSLIAGAIFSLVVTAALFYMEGRNELRAQNRGEEACASSECKTSPKLRPKIRLTQG